MRVTTAHSIVVAIFVGASLPLVACVSNATGSAQLTTPIAKDAEVIGEGEMLASNATTVYEVVERTRPRLLTSRIDLAPTAERQVYMNGARLGGIDQLRRIPASAIREIRFVRSVEGGGGGGGNAGAAIILIGRVGH
jgi:hypothetical protein